MIVKLLAKAEFQEEALKLLRVSSPKALDKRFLWISVVAISDEDITQYLQPIGVNKIYDSIYILHGSVDDWERMFLNNPPVDLNPFFHVLSPAISVIREEDFWKSK